jgi:peptidyl-prolyl cis-trans isomerase SurA
MYGLKPVPSELKPVRFNLTHYPAFGAMAGAFMLDCWDASGSPGGDLRLQVEAFRWTRARSAVLSLVSCGLLAAVAGCHRQPSPDVAATVNGKEILRSELERNYRATVGDTPQETSPEQANITRLSILDQMINSEIIQQRAAKLNLAASDEDVNAKLTELKAPYTQEGFDKHLKEMGVSLDDFKRELRRNLTSAKLLNKEIESKIDITDAEIGSYYAAHKAEFNLIEPRYGIAEIVVTATPSAQGANANLQNNKATSETDAKKKIQALYTKLESGEDFTAVAENFSEDPNTAPNGGDMGFVFESQLRENPEAYDAIEKLKPGQFTEVLPITQGTGGARRTAGFAIYKLLSREAAGQRTLNDPNVQQWIRQQLRSARAQLLRSAFFEVIRNQAQVRNYFAEQILKQGAK